MSYSFSVKAATKAEALADATKKYDDMVLQQPVHSRDRELALSNLRAHLDMAADPVSEAEGISISMHGSISVQTPTAGPERVTNVGSGCTVNVGFIG